MLSIDQEIILIKALIEIKNESGSHTVSISNGSKTGFSKIYDIADKAINECNLMMKFKVFK